MPPRKHLTEEELEEIRNLRGQMSAKEIQTKYGIGAPRLYRIWREATKEQPTVQDVGTKPIGNETKPNMDIPLQDTNRIEPNTPNIPVQSNAEQAAGHLQTQLLLRMQNTLENIDSTLQNIGSRIMETQEEVESVASDVEDIDDKVEDLEIDANTIASMSQKIYDATKTVEQVVYFGIIALAIVSALTKTWRHIERTKKEESFEKEPKVEEPKQKAVANTNTVDYFDMPPYTKPDPFAMD